MQAALQPMLTRHCALSHGGCEEFSANWSPDSRWLTYTVTWTISIMPFIFTIPDKKKHQVTNGYYNCSNPVFDTEGKYLYLTTNQSFTPYYSDIDNSFIYSNTTQIAAISLKKAPLLCCTLKMIRLP